MKFKNNTATIALVTALLALPIVLTGCGETKQYPAKVILTFVKACVSAGSPVDTCNCTLDVLRKNISFEDYAIEETAMAASGKMSTNMSKQLGKAKAACL